jgi:phosphoribosylformylglycinamidine synthase
MLCAVTPENLSKVLDILASYEIPHSVIGRVNRTGHFVCVYNDVVCTDMPVPLLTDDAPVYTWPVSDRTDYLSRWTSYTLPPAETKGLCLSLPPSSQAATESQKIHARISDPKTTLAQILHLDSGLHQVLAATLKLPAFMDRKPLFQHYCATVGGQTVLADGAHMTGAAAVVRLPQEAQPMVKGSDQMDQKAMAQHGIAVAGGCWERWVMIDPLHGASHGTAAVARKLVATGAVPRALTDCLNFGSPRNPDVMRQLSDAIDGINVVAKELKIPVVSGNVSLNNQTDGEPIPPTPMVGVAGDHPDVRLAVPSFVSLMPRHREALFQASGGGTLHVVAVVPVHLDEHVSYTMSEPALLWSGSNKGPVPSFDVTTERHLWTAVQALLKEVPPLTLSQLEDNPPEKKTLSRTAWCRPSGRGGLYLSAVRAATRGCGTFQPSQEFCGLPAWLAFAEGQAGFLVALTQPLTASQMSSGFGADPQRVRLMNLGTVSFELTPSDTDQLKAGG